MFYAHQLSNKYSTAHQNKKISKYRLPIRVLTKNHDNKNSDFQQVIFDGDSTLINFKMDEDLQLYKIVLIGNSGTGKTNISSRYIKGVFTDGHQASVGVQFFTKTLNIKGKDVKITLWDTAGQERFMSIGKVYYKGARGILAIYDITEPQTYVDIQSWLRLANQTVNLSDITVFVVGNKADLEKERKVPYQRVIKQYKQEFDVDCWEVSAKTGHKIQEMFASMFQKIHQKSGQVKSSIFYGDSELVTYSQVDRQSASFVRKQNQIKEMQPIGEVIVEEQQQGHSPSHHKPYQLDTESKMTLTNYDQLMRIQQSKKKKRCCH